MRVGSDAGTTGLVRRRGDPAALPSRGHPAV